MLLLWFILCKHTVFFVKSIMARIERKLSVNYHFEVSGQLFIHMSFVDLRYIKMYPQYFLVQSIHHTVSCVSILFIYLLLPYFLLLFNFSLSVGRGYSIIWNVLWPATSSSQVLHQMQKEYKILHISFWSFGFCLISCFALFQSHLLMFYTFNHWYNPDRSHLNVPIF